MVILFCGGKADGFVLFAGQAEKPTSFFCSSPVAGSSSEIRSHLGRLLRLSGPHRSWGSHFQWLTPSKWSFTGGDFLFTKTLNPKPIQTHKKRNHKRWYSDVCGSFFYLSQWLFLIALASNFHIFWVTIPLIISILIIRKTKYSLFFLLQINLMIYDWDQYLWNLISVIFVHKT